MDNDVIPAVVAMKKSEVEVQQGEGRLKLEVKRSKQKKGDVTVPWKVVPQSNDSVYMNISGEK